MASTLIVRGRIELKDAGCLERALIAGGEYVRLNIAVTEVLKGEFTRTHVPLTFFAAPREHAHRYVPCADGMRRHIGKDRLIYLIRYTDQHFFLCDRFGGRSIVEFSTVMLDELRRSVARHATLAEGPPEPDVSLADDIASLLDHALEGPDQQLRAFMQLERLGPSAIPTLVQFLDDRRTLPTRGLLLQDRSDTEQPVLREYRPELVCDAICTLLHQQTGEQFGLEYCRPLEDHRKRETDGWRVFAHYAAEDPDYVALGEPWDLVIPDGTNEDTVLARDAVYPSDDPPADSR